MVFLGEEESAEFYREINSENDRVLEIHLELTHCHKVDKYRDVLKKIESGEVFEVYLSQENGSLFPVKYEIISALNRNLYIEVKLL